MDKKLFLSALLMLLVMLSTAEAQKPEPPRIVSWSNSKTGDAKTVFQVKPGEQITFSVKAEGAEKYQWLVDGTVQKAAKGAAFKWTVPNKKGMWKILVKATNTAREKSVRHDLDTLKGWTERLKGKGKEEFIRDMTDLRVYPVKARKEWIVSAFLKKVNPGESIKKAIDSLPPEGGIVELAPGVHNVRDTIVINRSNVTIHGTRKSEIRSHDPSKDIFVFYHENPNRKEDWKSRPALENFVFKGFRVTSGHKSCGRYFIHAWNVNNMTVEGILSECPLESFIVTNPTGTSTSARSRNIVISGNTVSSSILCCIAYTRRVRVLDNIVRGSRAHIHTDRNCGQIHIIGNRIDSVGVRRGVIALDVGRYYEVRGNVTAGSRWGLWIVAGVNHAIVENNKITKAEIGVVIRNQFRSNNILLRNNLIYGNSGHGINVVWVGYGSVHGSSDATITNNVISRNKGDGVRIHNQRALLNISNNVITDNGGYGINREKGNITHSHNDIWSNGKGNYNGCTAGPGDISKAPLFTNPSKGDFHLKSKAGRWDAKAKKWVKDNVTSPCIDAGDPKADYSKEPAPNGGRVNVGAYGNTGEASKSVVR